MTDTSEHFLMQPQTHFLSLGHSAGLSSLLKGT